MFSMEQCALFTDEAWRNAPQSMASEGVNATGDVEDSFSNMTTSANISTFDNLTQSLKMFDSEDA